MTPPCWAGALNGITRAAVIELARKKLGVLTVEDLFTPYNVYTADEVFLTGTAAEVIPVTRVDDRVIGAGKPGPLTRKLIGEFRALTKREGVKI